MKDESTLPDGLVRLEKHMAQSGMSSRREAKDLIARGLVFVNGKKVLESGFGIDPKSDKVTLETSKIPAKQTVIMYKPRGIETNATSPDSVDIAAAFPDLAHLPPVGRLDRDSEGLIILSDDGLVARAFTKQNSDVEKEYRVTVRELVTDEAMRKMARGIMLDGIKTKPATAKRINDHEFSIVLREGRKHQIRRMCDACKLTVEQLVRVRIAGFKISSMKSGDVKDISGLDIFKK